MRLRVQRAGMTYLLTNVGFSFLALNMLGTPQGTWAVLQKILMKSMGGIVLPVLYVVFVVLTTMFFVKRENFTARELYTASLFILVPLVGLYIVSLYFLGDNGSIVMLTGIAHFVGLAAISKPLALFAPLIVFPLGVVSGYFMAGGTIGKGDQHNGQSRKNNKKGYDKGKGSSKGSKRHKK